PAPYSTGTGADPRGHVGGSGRGKEANVDGETSSRTIARGVHRYGAITSAHLDASRMKHRPGARNEWRRRRGRRPGATPVMHRRRRRPCDSHTLAPARLLL